MKTTYILKRKTFSQYDETDRLKQMKDSDILAEQKKKGPGYGSVASAAAGGAVVGGVALGAKRLIKGKPLMKGAGKGALLGATIAGTIALGKRAKEAKATEFYNDRLEYAQRQAQRRERADWKQNMTQRAGYSY